MKDLPPPSVLLASPFSHLPPSHPSLAPLPVSCSPFPSAGCDVPGLVACPPWTRKPAEARYPAPGCARGALEQVLREADTSWLGRHLHIQLSPPESRWDRTEEREGSGQLRVRQNRFWTGETDGWREKVPKPHERSRHTLQAFIYSSGLVLLVQTSRELCFMLQMGLGSLVSEAVLGPKDCLSLSNLSSSLCCLHVLLSV